MSSSTWFASLLLSGATLVRRAEAKIPWHRVLTPTMPPADSSVTFDPLGVAAILDNPRAFASSSRLYTQRDIDIFRWPPLNMIGGTLPPVSCLVKHLASRATSIHPALTLALSNEEKLRVQSDTMFTELPINFSNIWMRDVLTYRSSDCPQYDILIVRLESIFGGIREGVRTWPLAWTINLIGFMSAFLTTAGVVLSVLAGDAWSMALFASYLYHFIASKAVSIRPLVTHFRPKWPIMPDDTIRHAIYKRPEGGFVIFKAEQDVFETWARSTWVFRRSVCNNIIHWNWMISGFIAALASVVCMVNMSGYLQLGFLGILLFASAAEIFITHCSRRVVREARHFGAVESVFDNDTWSQAIARACLTVDEPFRLNRFDFIGAGHIPDVGVFRNMQSLLQRDWDESDPSEFDALIDQAMVEGVLPKKIPFAQRIANEIKTILRSRYELSQKSSSIDRKAPEKPVWPA